MHSDIGLTLFPQVKAQSPFGFNGSRISLRLSTLKYPIHNQYKPGMLNSWLKGQFQPLAQCHLACTASHGPVVGSHGLRLCILDGA